ncbi:MAG: YfbM family protein [Erysipelotrichaceae bacterium]|jgi:hypothetical protein|nr:YfbM family protein [Erysipelotrichaceae bacterium]
MSMIGCYVQLDDRQLQELKGGKYYLWDLFDMGMPALSIEKSWDALSHILYGGYDQIPDTPAGYIIPLGENCLLPQVICDYGCGAVLSSQVVQACDVLKDMDEAWFRAHCDFSTFQKDHVYVYSDTDEDQQELFEELYSYFISIKEFFEEAKENKNNIVFFIE